MANDTYYPSEAVCYESSPAYTFTTRKMTGVVQHYIHDDDQLKRLLMKQGPVSASLFVPSSSTDNNFFQYDSGVFECLHENEYYDTTNHAIVVVGWTENGDWIIKNTWGYDWGQSGYMILSKDKNCGLKRAREAEFEPLRVCDE